MPAKGARLAFPCAAQLEHAERVALAPRPAPVVVVLGCPAICVVHEYQRRFFSQGGVKCAPAPIVRRTQTGDVEGRAVRLYRTHRPQLLPGQHAPACLKEGVGRTEPRAAGEGKAACSTSGRGGCDGRRRRARTVNLAPPCDSKRVPSSGDGGTNS
eukprot:scaffold12741_cov171-Isochrysis_galbana.AAC.3